MPRHLIDDNDEMENYDDDGCSNDMERFDAMMLDDEDDLFDEFEDEDDFEDEDEDDEFDDDDYFDIDEDEFED